MRRHRRTRVRGLAVALSLTSLLAPLTGCAGVDARYGERLQDASYKEYLKALERSTAEVKLYEQLETRLLATATLHTPDFMKAYARELARAYRLTEAEQTERTKKLTDRAGGQLEVLVWVSSAQAKHAMLETRDSLWRLKLYNGQGQHVTPAKITLVKRPSAEDEHFYPYIASPGRVYLVTFPIQPEGGALFLEGESVTLQLAGVLGVAELTWKLRG